MRSVRSLIAVALAAVLVTTLTTPAQAGQHRCQAGAGTDSSRSVRRCPTYS